ncbi:hypothetical protein HMPREF0653_00231 [Prevotella disiens JCM 6334 = ATCC 29426]|uniref:Uncharacterized protein n=1 Tax=Prevotella disiens JCM 6334 = ATCC 29426 TaxID=1235811 RepID=A0ABN0NVF2_9BACT|nr:hypothetical protein HMPREF0653_00231 [Prevotella disiens JCM 6334 = ATCC 29426]
MTAENEPNKRQNLQIAYKITKPWLEKVGALCIKKRVWLF